MKIVPYDVFKDYSVDNKLNTLYILVVDNHEKIDELENRRKTHKAAAVGGGFIGGFTAMSLAVLSRMLGWLE